MRLFTLLKNTITVVKSIYTLMTNGSTLEDGYVVFPNGFKVCWGSVANFTSGGKVTLPISFTSGYMINAPIYYTVGVIRCTFTSAAGFSGNTANVWAFDTSTNALSTYNKLNFTYVAFGF